MGALLPLPSAGTVNGRHALADMPDEKYDPGVVKNPLNERRQALGEYSPSERWSARALVAGIASRGDVVRDIVRPTLKRI